LERFLQCPASNPFAGGGDSDLPFGQLNTYTANLQFSQRVYDGGLLRAQERQARAGREAATIGVTTTRAQLNLDVATAYYDAALSDRLVTITEATLTQAGETLRQIELQLQVGQIAEFEALRARVTRDNQRAAVIRTTVQRDLAYLRLKQLINVPADQAIELDANLTQPTGPLATRWSAPLAEAEANLRLVDRVVVRQSEIGVQANEAAVEVTQSAFRPQVSLTSVFTAYAYDPLPKFNRRDWTVGASVSLPLLDGGRRKANRAIAEATLEESRQQLQMVKELADLDQRSAHATYQAARASWEASAGTVEQAQRAHQIADVRYREGLSTQLELNDARLALERAEAERAQAAHDLQVARARLALLPDLPLGAATASATASGAATAAGSGGAQQTGQAGTAAGGAGTTGAPTGAAGGAGTQGGVRQ
ncbi:MAG TPA: TolC family protein, partial [Luteitalea sp.]|nr:TolC family protein [Luteitalea sp.]